VEVYSRLILLNVLQQGANETVRFGLFRSCVDVGHISPYTAQLQCSLRCNSSRQCVCACVCVCVFVCMCVCVFVVMVVDTAEKAEDETDPEDEEHEIMNMPSLRSVINGTQLLSRFLSVILPLI